MGTTRNEIRQWLEEAKAKGATHMLVVCDTFDYEDYPVSVMSDEDPRTKCNEYNAMSMQRVMECYALHLDIEEQLTKGRVFNFDAPSPSSRTSTDSSQNTGFTLAELEATRIKPNPYNSGSGVSTVLPQIGWKDKR